MSFFRSNEDTQYSLEYCAFVLGISPDSLAKKLRRDGFENVTQDFVLDFDTLTSYKILDREKEIKGFYAKAFENKLKTEKQRLEQELAKESQELKLAKNLLEDNQKDENLVKELKTEKLNLELELTKSKKTLESLGDDYKRILLRKEEEHKKSNQKTDSTIRQLLTEKEKAENEAKKLLEEKQTAERKTEKKKIKYPFLDAVNIIELAFIAFEMWLLLGYNSFAVSLMIIFFMLNAQKIAKKIELIRANANSMKQIKIIAFFSSCLHFYFLQSIEMKGILDQNIRIGVAIVLAVLISLISYKAVETTHKIAIDNEN